MKNIMKILIPFIVIALTVCATLFIVSAESERDAWTPTGELAEIYFGVWESEEDYLSGNPPVYTDLNDGWDDGEEDKVVLRAMFIKSLDAKYQYVRLFRPMEFSSFKVGDTKVNSILTKDRTLTLDLGGNRLSIVNYGNFIVSDDGTPAHMTVKNGDIYNERQLHFRKNSSLTLDHVTYKATNSLGYASGGALYVIDSYVETSAKRPVYLGAHSEIGEIKFVRSDLVATSSAIASGISGITSSSDDAIFVINCNEAKYDLKWKISFDKDSSISVPNATSVPNLISVIEKVERTEGYGAPEIRFELGCKFDVMTVPAFEYVYLPYGASEYELRDSDEFCSIKVVRPGSTDDLTDLLYMNSVGDGMYTLGLSASVGDASWYVSAEGDRIVKGIKGATVEGIDVPVMTAKDISSFPSGAVITIVEDIRICSKDSEKIENYKTDLTFDLGGNTVTLNNRWCLLTYDDASFKLTIKNGTINSQISESAYLFMGNMGVDGQFILEDVTVNHNTAHSSRPAIYPYNGSIIIKRCSITSNNYPIYCNEWHGTYSLKIEDSELVGGKSAVKYKMNHNTHDTAEFINCTLVGGDLVFDLSDRVVQEGCLSGEKNTLNINVSGSVLKAGEIIKINKDMPSAVTLTLSETAMSACASVNGIHSLVYGEGEKLLSLDSAELPYKVGKVNSSLYTNLTLKSDFIVNFFIPVNTNIVSLDIDGVVYNVSELDSKVNVYGVGECYNIVVNRLLPHVAAGVVNYKVTYVDDGVTVTAEVGYSVITYINTLLESEYSHLVKKLAVSAAEYIASAYEYADKTSDKLDELRSSEIYALYLTEITAPENKESGIGGASAAIRSAHLDLGATMKMRFNLQPSFTGTLKLEGTTYDVALGKVGEVDYILIEMSAYDMYDEVIEISGDGFTGEYSLSEYVSSIISDDGVSEKDKKLVLTFYKYTECANAYVIASVGE